MPTPPNMVKKFWREKVKRTDLSYPTTYNIYVHGNGWDGGKIENVRTLEQADKHLQALIEDSNTDWTYGIIYEMRPLVRRGTSYVRPKKARQ